MPIFSQRHSSEWHRQVDASSNGQHPCRPDGELNPEFPWARLEKHTIDYVQRKGKLTTIERDKKLAALIRDHGAKDIAIASCVILMSPKTVKNMVLGELNVAEGRPQDLYEYFQVIVAASENSYSISKEEAQRARLIIPFCSRQPSEIASTFQPLMTLLKDVIPTSSILYQHTITLTRLACQSFAKELGAMKMDNLWLQAYNAAEWLSTLYQNLLLQTSTESARLIYDNFPAWHIWAKWKPNIERLQLWQNFTTSQRTKLRDLMELEGPDFTESGKSTLMEGLIRTKSSNESQAKIDHGALHIELNTDDTSDARLVTERLLQVIDDACRGGSDQIDLLAHFCVGPTVDSAILHVLELVNILGDATVTAAMLRVHNAISKSDDEQVAALGLFLSTLDSPHANKLREVLEPYLVDCARNCLYNTQVQLRKLLSASNAWDGTEIKLQKFGQRLKDTVWIRPLLSGKTQALLENWPPEKIIQTLHDLRPIVLSTPNDNSSFIAKLVNDYCMHSLVSPGAIESNHKELVEAFVEFWQQEPDFERRSIAIAVAGSSSDDLEYIIKVLKKLFTLPDDFTKKLWTVLQLYYENIDKDMACIWLAEILSSTHLFDAIGTWRPVLDRMITQRGQLLADYGLKNSDAKNWIQGLCNLRSIYGVFLKTDKSIPALWRRLIKWSEELEAHLTTISWLQTNADYENALKCIEMGSDDDLQEVFLLTILDTLRDHPLKRSQLIFCKALSMLERDGSNAESVSSVLALVSVASPSGIDACNRVLHIYSIASASVAESFLYLYKNSPEVTNADIAALNELGKILGMFEDSIENVLKASWETVTLWMIAQFEKLYKEAQRLEDFRQAYKSADPEGTAALLERIGIEDSTSAQDTILSLPSALIDLVEVVGDQEIEMQIPLTLTGLQRVALGVGTAKNIIVRLNLPESMFPLAFCLHLDNESRTNDGGHSPWMVSEGNRAPVVSVCYGRPNRALYQLSRALFRHLAAGYTSLEDVHRMLIATLKEFAAHCIVCGVSLNSQLRRSTLCNSAECGKIFGRSRSIIRLSDIHDDSPAIDAMLSFVYSAALTNKPELLPGCPINNCQTITQILDRTSAIYKLKSDPDLSAALKLVHVQAEELLSWTANSFRGFFTSATDHLRIPGMAGSHQFILASAAPELEAAFAAQVVLSGGSTRVVFHATSLDRVFAILTQGLRVQSGTALQRYGAQYGNGIYVSEAPSTAASYFGASTAATWSGGTMKNLRVLLGCELAGTGIYTGGTQIHVVNNPSQLMVRHVFLMPPAAVVPTLPSHVTPAMQSVYSFLRSAAP